ncbi:MAG: DUF4426 domain-containing protein [Chromatiaceae bacterium]
MKHTSFLGLLCAAALLMPSWASAENSTNADGFTIHHNAFSADTLTPEIAKAYGLQRSKFRGLLNVSVIKDVPDTTGTPVPADLKAEILLLTGQKSPLVMKEIREGNAIYYIGEFPVQNAQTINFAIEVKPQGSEKAVRIRMDQEFFTE